MVTNTHSLNIKRGSYEFNVATFHSANADWQDYLALLKPRVMSLVVFTAFVGYILAPQQLNTMLCLISLFAIALGAGAAGGINMWYDRDIDAIMQRTQMRPIPAGRITPETALGFSISLAIFSVVLLYLAAGPIAAALLAFSIIFYAVIYTCWLKRTTPQNIVIGGAAGAFPPFIAWVACSQSFHIMPVLLFLIIFFWTPPHFWALALAKGEEYKRANIPMMPHIKGTEATKKLIVYYAIILSFVSLLPVILGYSGYSYGIGALILNGLFVIGSFQLKRYYSDKKAMQLFGFSILYLFLIFMFLMFDHVFA